ncbi:alkaline-phosphatase-like protein [Dactylonectria macrodidyma]|uniref:Alkaline-phosphatase-like protein n=1 Tax=Dactylonectria macrodidyma TaxID=307937 RepID=A0A9P9DME7_9HYPO|nr:alkaline-phosphatase-like protein [Dactylonectria macrodidyma]
MVTFDWSSFNSEVRDGHAGKILRRFVDIVLSRTTNRRFLYALGATALLGAKAVHVGAYLETLSKTDIFFWGLSFFAQDVVALLIMRLLVDPTALRQSSWPRRIALGVGYAMVASMVMMAIVSISFYEANGSEIHWRNASFIGGGLASIKFLVTKATVGLALLVLSLIVIVSWLAQDLYHLVAGAALDVLVWPFTFIKRTRSKYAHLPQTEDDVTEKSRLQLEEDEDEDGSVDEEIASPPPKRVQMSNPAVLGYTLMTFLLLATVLQLMARPNNTAFPFLSWTLPLLPFADFKASSPVLANIPAVFDTSINHSWDNITALVEPVDFTWLPKQMKPAGFEDWFTPGMKHYSAAADPMRVSNLDSGLLPSLIGKLGGVKIKNVVIIKLESTRKDAFPVKKNGTIWETLEKSWGDEGLPVEAQTFLSTAGATANFLTGDYDDGFEHASQTPRGGINCNNALTTSTYTLKSLTGTLCGITPLVADFNVEYNHHIYQPCLPQIFDVLNMLPSGLAAPNDFTSHKWRSRYIQSTTIKMDKQEPLTEKFGFPMDTLVTTEYLDGPSPQFGHIDRVTGSSALPEPVLNDYIRDTFQSAKKKNERVFLTMLTSSPHFPFRLPADKPYVQLGNSEGTERLHKYMNTIGFVDNWLGDVLDILDEEGVANETLVIAMGDHGLCVTENHCASAYYSPHISSFKVPLVLSHPGMPAITIDDSVSSMQVLPTILDLLAETGSLSEAATAAARDLLHNYEGQSLIRPLKHISETSGQANWQFTVMNPGRAQLSVRDTSNPQWRLVVPIEGDLSWRFTNLETDPNEWWRIYAFGFEEFLEMVKKSQGQKAAAWAESAAFMTRWWLEENWRRWRYDAS